MTTIIFLISQIVPGAQFMWNEDENKTFTILAVHENPEASFRGRKLFPYADVQWSDEHHPSTMNLKSIETGVRQGWILPPVD